MNVEQLIVTARDLGASDLHLESGLPAAVRVRGDLRVIGEPLPAKGLLESARDLIGAEQWPRFLERRSFDFSRTLAGVRCRINIFQTARGVSMAIRLLASFQATIEKLNLHPDLKRFVNHTNGLVLVSGATGSGKSSTLAALIQEINLTESRHVMTIESPIEYTFRPRQAYIRQREVGRDTPSFEQALLDALREDPDVLMVGEMREPETMRLTLNAAETGHLVLATVHSSTCAEALQRVVSAFPAEVQSGVRAQLADCLVGVICQRLRFRPDLKIRVPECEILVSTMAVKNFIRMGDFYKLISQMEMGADHGMWSFTRYQTWLENKKTWHFADPHEKPDNDIVDVPGGVSLPTSVEGGPPPIPVAPGKQRPAAPEPGGKSYAAPTELRPRPDKRPIEIEPVEGGLEEVIRKLKSE